MAQNVEHLGLLELSESADERHWKLKRSKADYVFFRGLAVVLMACLIVFIFKAKAWSFSTYELLGVIAALAPFVRYCLTRFPEKPKESITEKLFSLIRALYIERKAAGRPTPQLEGNRRSESLVERTDADDIR